MRTRRWWIAGASIALVTAAAAGLGAWSLRSGALKPRIEAALADALNCDVALGSLSVRVFPKLRLEGTGLSVRLRDRPDAATWPPFIEADEFAVEISLRQWRQRQVDVIHVDGLRLNVPPRRTGPSAPAAAMHARPFRIERLITHDAVLRFAGVTAARTPLNFAIHELDVADVGVERPMRFVARVTNPVPEVEVRAIGTFGAWHRDDPASTPLGGGFRIERMDLASINGMAGTASAHGAFTGDLSALRVTGETTVPDFSLDLGGRPRAVSATYALTIDGTNGTTGIETFDAVLGRTRVAVTGALTNRPGPRNIDITLAAAIDDGRIEDVLPLVIDAPTPFMTGVLRLAADVTLPPGGARLRERIGITGRFGLSGGRFRDPAIRARLDDLSRRGRKHAEDARTVVTALTGRVALDRGVARLAGVRFGVPGARISLDGRYTLASEAIALTGQVALDNSLSKAVGGFKSIFLKPFDPLFKRDGAGAVIPIRITGTRTAPKFGVRVKDALMRKKPPSPDAP